MTPATIPSLHRALPAFSALELDRAAQRPGRVRQAALHINRCGSCRRRAWLLNQLCPAGQALVRKIPRRRRRSAR